MVNEEVNKSWAIRTSTDELLNFIIFTGCMYNLIDDKNFDDSNTPWPTNLLNTDCKKAYPLFIEWWIKKFIKLM